MKKIMILFLLFITGSARSQGINFVELKDWKVVQDMAKKENKYIFVDFYATWCGPCKAMDKDVYPSPLLKTIFDQKYISIKVQIDQTDKDDEHIKQWYADAKMLRESENIFSLPTLFVFSPDGKPVYKQSGFMTINEVKEFAEIATDPQGGYEALVKKYTQGLLKEPEDLRLLALRAKKLKYQDIANKVAIDYKKYLDKFDPAKGKGEQFMFLAEFPQVVRTDDKWFQFLETQPHRVDSLMKIGKQADLLADFIIQNEYVYLPFLHSKVRLEMTEQTWKEVENRMNKKFGKKRTDNLLPRAKIAYYGVIKDWEGSIKANIETIEKNGLDTAGVGVARINIMVYNMFFEHAEKLEYLNKAIKWMEVVLDRPKDNPNRRDTYANLLYKVGRHQEAIAQQERAVATAKADKSFQKNLPDLVRVLEKMKRGEPTWPIDSLTTKQPI